MERIPSVKLTDNNTNTTYELDFNRESVKFAESRGFKIENLSDFPKTALEDLFFFSLRMHQKNRVSREASDKLLESWGGLPESVAKRLAELFVQAQTSNTIQTDEDAEKNGRLTVEL